MTGCTPIYTGWLHWSWKMNDVVNLRLMKTGRKYWIVTGLGHFHTSHVKYTRQIGQTHRVYLVLVTGDGSLYYTNFVNYAGNVPSRRRCNIRRTEWMKELSRRVLVLEVGVSKQAGRALVSSIQPVLACILSGTSELMPQYWEMTLYRPPQK